MSLLKVSLLAFFLLTAAATDAASPGEGPDAAVRFHGEFDRLLQRYVAGLSVDYAAWSAGGEDHQALGRYVDGLASLDPATWPEQDGLAYWINMYNAVTLRLVLDNYPLDSIKDIGGFLKVSPWKRELVTVAGRKLTLNDIENEIIRPTFGDPRIHFALNCASVGCPPLKDEAYMPGSLSDQLDESCTLALNRDGWVRVDGDKIGLTKIFDWYKDDFETDGGSVEAFINRYRDKKVSLDNGHVSFLSYDWSLNESP